VEFHIREITQGSKKKTYGPYSGYIEKLKEPIELKGRVIKYKPVAKLSGKKGVMKGGASALDTIYSLKQKEFLENNTDEKYKFEKNIFSPDKLFFGDKIIMNENYYYPFVLVFSSNDFAGKAYILKDTNYETYALTRDFLLGLGNKEAHKNFSNIQKEVDSSLMKLNFLEKLSEINNPNFSESMQTYINILTGK
jgi:hypothetical protein